MAYRLEDIEVEEVSLVDDPANGKKFLLFKGRNAMIAILRKMKDNERFIEEVASRLGIAPSDLIKAAEEKDEASLIEKLSQVAKDKQNLVEALKAILRELAEQYGYAYGYEYPAPSDEKEKTKKEEEVQKALSAIRKENEELRKKLEEAEKIIRQEREIRKRREYLDEAKRYKVPGASSEEIAELLKFVDERVEKSTEGLKEVVRKILKSVTEINKTLSDEIGDSSVPDLSDVVEKVNRLVEEKIQKSNGSLKYTDALSQVFLEHPDLYREYQNFTGRR
jgi:DNA repair exonuclease SbcCD ATPase subunit